MSKSFAKKFYNSDAWKNTRNAYIAERIKIDGGLCERCGAESDNVGEELHHKIPLNAANINDYNVTLNTDNLQWLCKDCHFKVHRELILESFNRHKRKKLLSDGCYFDENGELQKMSVKIIWGAPASGKSTYVTRNMSVGDMVVDLDKLNEAISYKVRDEFPQNLLPISIEMRDFLYKLIEERAVDAKKIWVIATLPKKKTRLELAERLGAELIHIDTDYHSCIERVKNDPTRLNKQLQLAFVDNYFETLEP